MGAWRQGFVEQAEGRLRVTLDEFTKVCEQSDVNVKHPGRLFRLLRVNVDQRTISLDDFEGLLYGLPREDRHQVWSEGRETKKPSAPPPRVLRQVIPGAKEFVKEEVQKNHEKLFAVTRVEAFKHLLTVKYGSLFAAWRQLLDSDGNGNVVEAEWAAACRFMGVDKIRPLWEEITKKHELSKEERDKIHFITFEDFDPVVGPQFKQFTELLTDGGQLTSHQGWQKHFERPDEEQKKTKRIDEAKFVSKCKELGFDGNAADFFKQLKPDPSRLCLMYGDLWPEEDPNCQILLRAAVEMRAKKRQDEDRHKIKENQEKQKALLLKAGASTGKALSKEDQKREDQGAAENNASSSRPSKQDPPPPIETGPSQSEPPSPSYASSTPASSAAPVSPVAPVSPDAPSDTYRLDSPDSVGSRRSRGRAKCEVINEEGEDPIGPAAAAEGDEASYEASFTSSAPASPQPKLNQTFSDSFSPISEGDDGEAAPSSPAADTTVDEPFETSNTAADTTVDEPFEESSHAADTTAEDTFES